MKQNKITTKLIIKYLSIIISIYSLSYIIDTIIVNSNASLLIMGLVLLLINMTLKPLLLLITLPFSLITLGLFTFVVNAWTILISDYFVSGIKIGGFLNALLISLIIVIINGILRDLNR